MLEMTVLGVGDTFSDRHHTTCVLLEADGVKLAIDCPDSYRRVLRAAGEISGRPHNLASIDHVLVTHVHGDHMNGVEGFAFFKHFAEGKRTQLLASPEVRQSISDERLRVSMGQLWDGSRFRSLSFDDYFVHTPLVWDETITVGPFSITSRRTIHHVPTSAVIVRTGGRSIGISSDTAFDPSLIEFLSDADLIVHETNYGPAHTPYEKLAALPEALRAKMRLIHYPDDLDLATTNIVPLREGMIVTV